MLIRSARGGADRLMKMDWSPRSRTSNPRSRSPVPKKSGPSRVRAYHQIKWETLRCLLTPADGVGFGRCDELPPGRLAPGEIGTMLVEIGTFVKEPMSESGH